MLTTKQVRSIMVKHGMPTHGVYTNKTPGDSSKRRRVKCYMPQNKALANKLLVDLREQAGAENVRVTSFVQPWMRSRTGQAVNDDWVTKSITVKCELA